MARWYSAEDRWVWQWDIEAMAFSQFHVAGAINKFQTIDFFASIPLEVRRGPCSGKFLLFHQSSHLGDDYIRDSGDPGFRYSVEGVRGILSAEPLSWLRVYGGGTYLLHSIPSPKRGALQAGLEFTTPELRLLRDYPTTAYLAQDIESHQNVQWNANSSSTLGLRIRFKQGQRSMRVYVGYFTGHSPYGQFFARPEHHSHIGISFDF